MNSSSSARASASIDAGSAISPKARAAAARTSIERSEDNTRSSRSAASASPIWPSESTARWALVLGASSGFGEAAARAFAAAGWDIFGVHLDRRQGLEHVEEIKAAIAAHGRQAHFWNANAADHDKRREIVAAMREAAGGRPVGVLMHSLAFGTLKPFIAADEKDAIAPQ